MIELPRLPFDSSLQIGLKSNALDLTPSFGGPVQRASRLGDKWTLEGKVRPLTYAQAIGIVAKLVQASSQRVSYPFPQDGLTIGSPGSPQVNGGSQLGTSLIADGFTAGYAVQAGQFFNVVNADGSRHLHQVTTAVTANGSGQATLSIFPMLRASPADNATLDFATPVIQGWLQNPQGIAWNVTLALSVGLSVSIVEGQ